MRLIDADILIKALVIGQNTCGQVVIDVIHNQPTAYDVDEVVEKIREYFKKQIDKEVDKLKVVDFSCEINKIIRAGGKE